MENNRVEFEYDPEKSEVNRKKHGIDFEKAQEIWSGPSVQFAAKEEYENRFAILGPVGEKLYTCIYTLRGERVRIISCRRARKKEVTLYEESTQKAQNR